MFSIYELEARVLLRRVLKNDRNEKIIIIISEYINDKKKKKFQVGSRKKKKECQSKGKNLALGVWPEHK